MVQAKIHKKYILIFTSFGLGLILLLSFFSYQSGQRYQSSNIWRNHSTEVLANLSDLHVLMERAETAQRGYVITEREDFLEPFLETQKLIRFDLENLERLVEDNSEQEQRLKELSVKIDKKFVHMNKVISLVKKGQASDAVRLVKTGIGKRIMDDIRQQFQDIEVEELRLLIERSQAAEVSFTHARVITASGLILSFFLLLTVTMILHKELLRRSIVEKELIVAESKANEASAMKSKFLANMSHEIRTPLNGIIGMTKVLSDTQLDGDQSDYVDTIRDSSHSLLSIINGILDLSKIESGKLHLEDGHFEMRSLVSSVKSILDFQAREKNLDLRVEIGEDVPDHFIGDALRIRQVLLNLVGNAVKFSLKGTIKIKIRLLENMNSKVRLLVEVFDQGIGLDEKTQHKLFQPFTQADDTITRRFGGTGLGLSISKQLVELMGGKIGVESATDKGSRFYFEIDLKLAKYDEQSGTQQNIENNESPIGAHVLIAEDNITNQKVVSIMLKNMGCTYKIAQDGFEAFELLKNESFDLILMDGHMPRMDGYEATIKIRSAIELGAKQNIPIIAVTANAIKGDTEKGFAIGMNDYVSKPISQVDLRAKLEKWLKSGSAVVDQSVLDRMKMLDPDGKDGLIHDLIDAFTQSAPSTFVRMRELLARRNYKELSQVAHHFKSTCANVGAVRMRGILDRIERVKSTDDARMTLELIETIEKDFPIILKELKKYEAA